MTKYIEEISKIFVLKKNQEKEKEEETEMGKEENETEKEEKDEDEVENNELRRSHRIRKKPSRYQDGI